MTMLYPKQCYNEVCYKQTAHSGFLDRGFKLLILPDNLKKKNPDFSVNSQ